MRLAGIAFFLSGAQRVARARVARATKQGVRRHPLLLLRYLSLHVQSGRWDRERRPASQSAEKND